MKYLSFYFLVTFSSRNIYLATRKTNHAMIIKFMTADKKGPQPRTIADEPQRGIENVAVCHAPPGMKGVKIGIIIVSTVVVTSFVAAVPITNAIARPVTLYSLMKSLNSCKSCFIR